MSGSALSPWDLETELAAEQRMRTGEDRHSDKILHGSLSFASSSTGPGRAEKEAVAAILLSPSPRHISVSPRRLLWIPTPNPSQPKSLVAHLCTPFYVRSLIDKKV